MGKAFLRLLPLECWKLVTLSEWRLIRICLCICKPPYTLCHSEYMRDGGKHTQQDYTPDRKQNQTQNPGKKRRKQQAKTQNNSGLSSCVGVCVVLSDEARIRFDDLDANLVSRNILIPLLLSELRPYLYILLF